MPPPIHRATWADLARLPEDVRAEIVDGVVQGMPSPSVEHQEVFADLLMDLRGPFQRGRGGPGGWWIIPDVDVELGPHDVVRPDLAGWRRERVPERPQRPVSVVPDWVCEVLSPGNARHDRLTKMELYRRYGVAFVWLVDPMLRVLEADRLESLYVRLGAWSEEPDARIPPFDAVPLNIGELLALGSPQVDAPKS